MENIFSSKSYCTYGICSGNKNIEHIRKEHNELFDIPNFAKYYYLKIIIGLKENPDGYKFENHKAVLLNVWGNLILQINCPAMTQDAF